MFDQILLPVDGSDGTDAATDHVLDIADAHDGTVHVLNVADTNQASLVQMQGDIVDVLVPEGERVVDEVADRARERNVETVTQVRQGDPDSTIVEYAESEDVDLIVMPTRGRRKLERFLLGSTTERVLRQAETPVLTLRPDETVPEYPYSSVLVPTDGSACADEALAVAVDLANQRSSALQVLSVVAVSGFGDEVPSDTGMAAIEREAEEAVDEAVSVAERNGVESVTGAVEFSSSIYRQILSYVDDHDVSAIVVGTHGRTGVERYLLGSVTEYLVRTSPVPVLAVREPTDGE